MRLQTSSQWCKSSFNGSNAISDERLPSPLNVTLDALYRRSDTSLVLYTDAAKYAVVSKSTRNNNSNATV
jgi:hypothetical protein